MDKIKDLLTTGEAAEICNVSQQTIIRCFDSGWLEGFRIPVESPAAGRSLMHTVSFFLRDPVHFEMPGGVTANNVRLLPLPLGLVICGTLCYACVPP